MLKLSDLAGQPDFQLGPLEISPSRRLVEGPTGKVHLEPLIMQVLLLLVDARDSVVTRETLFDQCWGAAAVGDDSLNRALAKVRRSLDEVAPGVFEIETIPRTGYRLTGEFPAPLDAEPPSTMPAETRDAVSRRLLLGGSVAAATLVGAGGLLWVNRARSDPRFDDLMRQGQEALRKMNFGEQTTRIFEQAVRIDPDSASALGALALVRSLAAAEADPKDSDRAVRSAEEAARLAFARNPKEPNALMAMFELQGSTLDWWTRDQRLRQIIAIDPKNILAITELVGLLQAAGLNQESWNWNERAIAIEPLLPVLLGRKALKLWIAGRVLEADKVVDQVRGLWPSNFWGWWVQFLILTLSGRPRAARAMLESDPGMLDSRSTPGFWMACLAALDLRSPTAIVKAREACFDAAKSSGVLAAHGVMILSALGQVDAAYEVTDGFLLWRGPIVRGSQSTSKQVRDDAGWRLSTQWLFTPPCAAMRADPRFIPLCEGIGLTDYWRKRGVKPDYLLRRT